jgi:hypothetical protein
LYGQTQVNVKIRPKPKETPMPDNVPINENRPTLPVTVRRHRIDWDNDQFDVVTGKRIQTLGRRLSSGSWYLNPEYTVSCSAPTAEFFQRVKEVQSDWRWTRRKGRPGLGNHGLKQEAKKAVRQGRRAAFWELDLDFRKVSAEESLPQVIPLQSLPPTERQYLIQAGRLAKQLAFCGVMFFEGELVPPPTWNEMADKLLSRKITDHHRHLDLIALKATCNLDPLRQLTLSVLRSHLIDHPTQPVFITPHRTVRAPKPNETFYRKAEQSSKQWWGLLKRTLGNSEVRKLSGSVDPLTYMTVFRGVLWVDGNCYWPGCWPGQTPTPKILKHSPNNSPIVPLDFFGLKSTSQTTLISKGDQRSSTSTSPPVDPTLQNDLFKQLFVSSNP